MQAFLGSFALIVCFSAIVVSPYLLPRLPPPEAPTPPRDEMGEDEGEP